MISKVGLIIVCAGSGRRLGCRDKAFVKLNRKPLFLHAFTAFRKFKQIKQIVFVFKKNSIRKAKALVNDNRAVFVKGGKYRKDSVFNGLKALGKTIEYVLIHDGARPLVSKQVIKAVLSGLEEYPAVISAVSASDTVKSASNSFVTKTLDRREIFLAQTPQGFKKNLLLKAYEKYSSRKLTDDANFFELLGKKVNIVNGERSNIKITYPEDMKVARFLIQGRLK